MQFFFVFLINRVINYIKLALFVFQIWQTLYLFKNVTVLDYDHVTNASTGHKSFVGIFVSEHSIYHLVFV